MVRPLVDSSGGDFSQGGLNWAPVIEAQIGKGALIGIQLCLKDRWQALPVADCLLANALLYLAEFTPAPAMAVGTEMPLAEVLPSAAVTAPLASPVTLFAGSIVPVQSAAEVRRYAEAGNVVLVNGLDDAALAYWETVIGRRIELWTPEHAVYQLIASPPASPLLRGISNEDTCWLENFPYQHSEVKAVIADKLLTIDGAIVHLRNASRSGLDILFGDSLASEWRTMPLISALLDNPEPRVGGGLVEIPVGEGRVIFSQMIWNPAHYRFARTMGLLLWNLGVSVASNILHGETTPTTGKQSDGYPRKVYAVRGGQGTLQEILSFSKLTAESYSGNYLFHSWPGWQVVETPLHAGEMNGGEPIILAMDIATPEARKLMKTLGGLPNPDLQTFLRLRGAGVVKAWVNAVPWGEVTLNPDADRFIADIDLEAGSNFVVLQWTPAHDSDNLSFDFVDKDRRPETSFKFADCSLHSTP